MRKTLRFLYYAARNARWAVTDALLGENKAQLRYLQRQGRVIIGTQTVIRAKVWADRHGTECLRVGNYSGVAGTCVLGGNHGPDRVSTYPMRIWWGLGRDGDAGWPIPTGDTILGSDVWACENCLILPGVTIGDGAVIAAGAVVTKDVPPFAMVGGNPAQLIRYRFTEEQREALLEIRWWDWSEDKVRAAVPWLESEDVDAFIAYARGEALVPSGITAR